MIVCMIPASVLSVFARGKGVAANNTPNQSHSLAPDQQIPETVVVDGVLDDTGWPVTEWIEVDSETGSWNIQYPDAETDMPLTYDYQLTNDFYSLYGAFRFNSHATTLHIYLKDYDLAASVDVGYTAHLEFDIADKRVVSRTSYDPATGEYVAITDDAHSPAERFAYKFADGTDGGTILEFQQPLTDIYSGMSGYGMTSADVNMNIGYFVAVESVAGSDNALYHPMIAPFEDGYDRTVNFPHNGQNNAWPSQYAGEIKTTTIESPDADGAMQTEITIDGKFDEAAWTSMTAFYTYADPNIVDYKNWDNKALADLRPATVGDDSERNSAVLAMRKDKNYLYGAILWYNFAPVNGDTYARIGITLSDGTNSQLFYVRNGDLFDANGNAISDAKLASTKAVIDNDSAASEQNNYVHHTEFKIPLSSLSVKEPTSFTAQAQEYSSGWINDGTVSARKDIAYIGEDRQSWFNVDGTIDKRYFPEVFVAESMVYGSGYNTTFTDGTTAVGLAGDDVRFLHHLTADSEYLYGAMYIGMDDITQWDYANDKIGLYINNLWNKGYGSDTQYAYGYYLQLSEAPNEDGTRDVTITDMVTNDVVGGQGAALVVVDNENGKESDKNTIRLEFRIPVKDIGLRIDPETDMAWEAGQNEERIVFKYFVSVENGTQGLFYPRQTNNPKGVTADRTLLFGEDLLTSMKSGAVTGACFYEWNLRQVIDLDGKLSEDIWDTAHMTVVDHNNAEYRKPLELGNALDWKYALYAGYQALYLGVEIDEAAIQGTVINLWLYNKDKAVDGGNGNGDRYLYQIAWTGGLGGEGDNYKVTKYKNGVSLGDVTNNVRGNMTTASGYTQAEIMISLDRFGASEKTGFQYFIEVTQRVVDSVDSKGNINSEILSLVTPAPELPTNNNHGAYFPGTDNWSKKYAGTPRKLSYFIPDAIDIDKNLGDSGWKSDQWVRVTAGSNGTVQDTGNMVDGAPVLDYYYQIRMDDEYMYVAAVIEMSELEGSIGDYNPHFRVWIKNGTTGVLGANSDKEQDDGTYLPFAGYEGQNTFTYLYDVSFDGHVNLVDDGNGGKKYSGAPADYGLRAAANTIPAYPNGGGALRNKDYEEMKVLIDPNTDALTSATTVNRLYGLSALYGETYVAVNEQEAVKVDDSGRTQGEYSEAAPAWQRDGDEAGYMISGQGAYFNSAEYYALKGTNVLGSNHAITEFKVKLSEFLGEDNTDGDFSFATTATAWKKGVEDADGATKYALHYPLMNIEQESENNYRFYNMPFWYWNDDDGIRVDAEYRNEHSLRIYEKPVVTLGARIASNYIHPETKQPTRAIRFGGLYTEEFIRKIKGVTSKDDPHGVDRKTDYWDVKSLGTVVLPTSWVPLDENGVPELTLNTYGMASAEGNNIIRWIGNADALDSQNTNFADYENFAYYISLYNIPETQLDTKFSFCSYITYYDENGSAPYYDVIMNRSYNTVLYASQDGYLPDHNVNAGTDYKSFFIDRTNGIDAGYFATDDIAWIDANNPNVKLNNVTVTTPALTMTVTRSNDVDPNVQTGNEDLFFYASSTSGKVKDLTQINSSNFSHWDGVLLQRQSDGNYKVVDTYVGSSSNSDPKEEWTLGDGYVMLTTRSCAEPNSVALRSLAVDDTITGPDYETLVSLSENKGQLGAKSFNLTRPEKVETKDYLANSELGSSYKALLVYSPAQHAFVVTRVDGPVKSGEKGAYEDWTYGGQTFLLTTADINSDITNLQVGDALYLTCKDSVSDIYAALDLETDNTNIYTKGYRLVNVEPATDYYGKPNSTTNDNSFVIDREDGINADTFKSENVIWVDETASNKLLSGTTTTDELVLHIEEANNVGGTGDQAPKDNNHIFFFATSSTSYKTLGGSYTDDSDVEHNYTSVGNVNLLYWDAARLRVDNADNDASAQYVVVDTYVGGTDSADDLKNWRYGLDNGSDYIILMTWKGADGSPNPNAAAIRSLVEGDVLTMTDNIDYNTLGYFGPNNPTNSGAKGYVSFYEYICDYGTYSLPQENIVISPVTFSEVDFHLTRAAKTGGSSDLDSAYKARLEFNPETKQFVVTDYEIPGQTGYKSWTYGEQTVIVATKNASNGIASMKQGQAYYLTSTAGGKDILGKLDAETDNTVITAQGYMFTTAMPGEYYGKYGEPDNVVDDSSDARENVTLVVEEANNINCDNPNYTEADDFEWNIYVYATASNRTVGAGVDMGEDSETDLTLYDGMLLKLVGGTANGDSTNGAQYIVDKISIPGTDSYDSSMSNWTYGIVDSDAYIFIATKHSDTSENSLNFRKLQENDVLNLALAPGYTMLQSFNTITDYDYYSLYNPLTYWDATDMSATVCPFALEFRGETVEPGIDINDANYVTGANSISASFFNSKYYTNMSKINGVNENDRSNIIAIALSQIGYLEGQTASMLSGTVPVTDGNDMYNNTEYNNNYGGNGYEWCASFVSWAFLQSGVSTSLTTNTMYRATYVPTLEEKLDEAGLYMYSDYYRSHGWTDKSGVSHKAPGTDFYQPRTGDLVFFDHAGIATAVDYPMFSAHVGLVVYSDDTYVYTIEGNTSSLDGVEASGGGVFFKKYKLYDNDQLTGFGAIGYKNDASNIDYSGKNRTTGLYMINAALGNQARVNVYSNSALGTVSTTVENNTVIEVTAVYGNVVQVKLDNDTVGYMDATNLIQLTYIEPTASADNPVFLNQIVVNGTGVTAPGADVSTAIDATSDFSVGTGYHVTDAKWYLGDAEYTAAAFEANTDYVLKVTVDTNEFYYFASGITATYNGVSAEITTNNDGTVTLTYTYRAVTGTGTGGGYVADTAGGGFTLTHTGYSTGANTGGNVILKDITNASDDSFTWWTNALVQYDSVNDIYNVVAVSAQGSAISSTDWKETGGIMLFVSGGSNTFLNGLTVGDKLVLEGMTNAQLNGLSDSNAAITISGATFYHAKEVSGDLAARLEGGAAVTNKNLAVPEYGISAVFDATEQRHFITPDGAKYTVIAQWVTTDGHTPVTGEFGAETEYSLELSITPANGYVFIAPLSNSDFTFGGRAASELVFNSATGSVKAYYTYTKTGKAPESLGTVMVMGGTTPATGNKPANGYTVEAQANYTYTSSEWYVGDTALEITENTVFEPNTAYTIRVTLTAKDGYAFTDTTAAKLGQNDMTVVAVGEKGATIVVSYTYPATDALPVGGFTLSMELAAPVRGQSADRDFNGLIIAPATYATYTSAEWVVKGGENTDALDVNAGKYFAANTEYMIAITLTAKDGYSFNNITSEDYAKYTFNSHSATMITVDNVDGTVATFTYDIFDATGEAPAYAPVFEGEELKSFYVTDAGSLSYNNGIRVYAKADYDTTTLATGTDDLTAYYAVRLKYDADAGTYTVVNSSNGDDDSSLNGWYYGGEYVILVTEAGETKGNSDALAALTVGSEVKLSGDKTHADLLSATGNLTLEGKNPFSFTVVSLEKETSFTVTEANNISSGESVLTTDNIVVYATQGVENVYGKLVSANVTADLDDYDGILAQYDPATRTYTVTKKYVGGSSDSDAMSGWEYGGGYIFLATKHFKDDVTTRTQNSKLFGELAVGDVLEMIEYVSYDAICAYDFENLDNLDDNNQLMFRKVGTTTVDTDLDPSLDANNVPVDQAKGYDVSTWGAYNYTGVFVYADSAHNQASSVTNAAGFKNVTAVMLSYDDTTGYYTVLEKITTGETGINTSWYYGVDRAILFAFKDDTDSQAQLAEMNVGDVYRCTSSYSTLSTTGTLTNANFFRVQVVPSEIPTAIQAETPDLSATAKDPGNIKVAYVPLDDRPVHKDRVEYLAQASGILLSLPNAEDYTTQLGSGSNGHGGNPMNILNWLKQQEREGVDYYVIALDQVFSGGLVNSRYSDNTYGNGGMSDNDYEIAEFLVELSKNNYVVFTDTVMRLAATENYKNQDSATYNAYRHYGSADRYVLSNTFTLDELFAYYRYGTDSTPIVTNVTGTYSGTTSDNVAFSINADLLKYCLAARERKMRIIDYLVRNAGSNIDHLLIGSDDSEQNTVQDNERQYIKNICEAMNVNYSMFAGADEMGSMGLSVIANYTWAEAAGGDSNNRVPVSVEYFGVDGIENYRADMYDYGTLKDNVDKHIAALGGYHVSDPSNDDKTTIRILVLGRPWTGLSEVESADAKTYSVQLVARLKECLDNDLPVALIDASNHYGGHNNALADALCEYGPNGDGTELIVNRSDFAEILGFSAWNTVGNAVGLSLANAFARYGYLNEVDSATALSNEGFIKTLTFSFIKDVCYRGSYTYVSDYKHVFTVNPEDTNWDHWATDPGRFMDGFTGTAGINNSTIFTGFTADGGVTANPNVDVTFTSWENLSNWNSRKFECRIYFEATTTASVN